MSIDFSNIMKHKTAYFDMEEVDKMLQYCEETDRIRDYMLILILLRTGRRITEVVGDKPYNIKVGLRPCDIRSDGLIEWDILKKNHIKTTNKSGQKKSQEVLSRLRINKTPIRKLKPIDEDTLEMLKEYIQVAEISPTQRIFDITRSRADQIIKHIAHKCNIKRDRMKIHCHMFRHTFAIHLLKDNPNNLSIIRYVQELLDHSDINVTMTYAQFTQQDKKEVLDKTFAKVIL